MHFRWRENPAVIAQYMVANKVPEQAEVTLKPNEICVVLENGKVVGSVSQHHMEVNPEIGMIGRLFGKQNPQRSFMFCFTGPHQIMVQVKGQSNLGSEINCLVSIKVEITRESAPRLLTFPAKGTLTIHASDIAKELRSIVGSNTLNFLKNMNSEEMRTLETNEDLCFHLKSELRSTFDEYGLQHRGIHIIWSSSVAEQRLQNESDLERIRLSKEADADRQELELNHMIQTEQRKHEINARLALVGVQAQQKAEMESELQRLENEGNLSFAEWSQKNRLVQAQKQSDREEYLKDAQTELEVSKLIAEQQKVMQSPAQHEKDEKQRRAMEMFEQVQAKKQERMRIAAEQEKERLDQHSKASENTISVLEKIASTATDPAVQMEALKQLAELRKTDVSGQKDAYKE
ncbi:MAG: hypothetical protein CMB55_03995 [Euryarchaeota archaeon]|nr:hypothetical protein [Euryarchaeota archaeon]|tara:strand:+ start:869 stop:2080 length:1212 start_codon:yes stop_codon:yes gene_type:complete